MGISCDAVAGFGLEINADEMARLAADYSELLGRECYAEAAFENEEYGGFLPLPPGFAYFPFHEYDRPPGMVVCIKNKLLNKAVRGESELPDFSMLLEWVDTHKIKVTSR